MLPWCPVCEHCSWFSLWEMPSGIQGTRDKWSGSVLCKVPQTGTTNKTATLYIKHSVWIICACWQNMNLFSWYTDFLLFFPGVWRYRWVSGPAWERRLHCQLTLLQHYSKATESAVWLLSHSLIADGPGFWLSIVLTRAPSAAVSAKLASQVIRWEAAMVPGFAPTVNPTPATPMPIVLWRETAALAVQ